jgi:hypothetical protein
LEKGGFDCIVGNPPYVRQEELGDLKEYFQLHYKTFQPTADLYVNFIEKGLSIIKPTGKFGMIVSNKWLRAAYGGPLRKFLTEKSTISEIIDFAGLPVFLGATVRTIILCCTSGGKQTDSIRYLPPVSMDEFQSIVGGRNLTKLVEEKGIDIPRDELKSEGWSFSSSHNNKLIARLQQDSLTLRKYVDGAMYRGIISGFNDAFIIDGKVRRALIAKNKANKEIIQPLVVGKDIRRYSLDHKDKYLIWTYVGVPIEKYPEIFKHLKKNQRELEKRWDQGKHWWELRHCDYYGKFEAPKIIYPDISTTCRFTLDVEGYFSSNTTYFIAGDDLYLLGLLNSRVGFFYFREVCAGLESGKSTYLRFFGQYLENFPVHSVRQNDHNERRLHDEVGQFVEKILALHKQLAATKTEQEKTVIQRQIDATDKQIDQLVYELYGLTEEEITIVEGKPQ